MALSKRRHQDFCVLLISLLYIAPLTVTLNNNCNGKSFHCVNSTHFTICVDVGGGVSMTVDDFVIQCPPTTFCMSTNNFECEYRQPTTRNGPIKKSEVTTDPTFLNVISLAEASSRMPMLQEDEITSVLPLDYLSSSKPSQPDANTMKAARPKAVSNIIKKDVVMLNIDPNDSPKTQKGLELGGDIGNKSKPSYTEPKTELGRLQNNMVSITDLNFTHISSTTNTPEVTTNIPNITEYAFEIDNKPSTSTDFVTELPILSSYNYPESTSVVPEMSTNGEHILSAHTINDIINENVKVAELQNTDTKKLFVNGTLTNASFNVSVSENLKPKLMHTPSIVGENNPYIEMQTKKVTNSTENDYVSNVNSNRTIDINGMEEQYPSNDKFILNHTKLENVSSNLNEVKHETKQSEDPTVRNDFHSTTSPSIISEIESPETLRKQGQNQGTEQNPAGSDNLEQKTIFPDKLKTIINNNSDIEMQLRNKTSNGTINANTNAPDKGYPKYVNMSSNSTLSNELINNTMENINSENIEPSFNGKINNLKKNENPTEAIDVTNSPIYLSSSENIKPEIMSPYKPKINSNYPDVNMQLQTTYNDGKSDSQNTSSNVNINPNINAVKDYYPKNDNLTLDSTLPNELLKKTTPTEVTNSSPHSTATLNMKPEVMVPDKSNTSSTNNSDMEMQLENTTYNDDNVNSLDISTNANINAAMEQYAKYDTLSPDNTLPNELLDKTTPSEVTNSSAHSTETLNMEPQVMIPDKLNTISTNNSDIKKLPQNTTYNDENINSLDISTNANKNETVEQYPKDDNLYLDTTLPNELLDKTTPNEVTNSSSHSTATLNMKPEVMVPDKSNTSSTDNSDMEMQPENTTYNDENINSLDSSTNVNINAIVEQYPKNDNVFPDTTLPNELLDKTMPSKVTNYSVYLSETLNMKPEVMVPDKSNTSSTDNSDMEMQPENTTYNDENINSLDSSTNANINAIVEQYPKYDNLSLDTTLPNELLDITLPTEITNSSSHSTAPFNMKPEIMFPHNPKTTTRTNNSDMEMQLENKPYNDVNVNSLDIITNANIIATKDQYPKYDNLSPETTLPDELLDKTATTEVTTTTTNNSNLEMQLENKTYNDENINSIDISTNVNISTPVDQYPKYDNVFPDINLSKVSFIKTVPTELTNYSVHSTTDLNMQSEVMFPDKSNTNSTNNSDMEIQPESTTYNDENINSLDSSTNAKINATLEQNPKYDNLSPETTLPNELLNKTAPTEVTNSSAHSTASLNVKPEIMFLDKPKTPSTYNSDMEMQSENKIYNDENMNPFNMSANTKINATENQFPKYVNLSLNNTLPKPGIILPDKTKTTSNNDSYMEMQKENNADNNGNIYSLNISSNVTIHANINATEEQYSKYDNLSPDNTLPNELLNKTASTEVTNSSTASLNVKPKIQDKPKTASVTNNSDMEMNEQYVKYDNLSPRTTLPKKLLNQTKDIINNNNMPTNEKRTTLFDKTAATNYSGLKIFNTSIYNDLKITTKSSPITWSAIDVSPSILNKTRIIINNRPLGPFNNHIQKNCTKEEKHCQDKDDSLKNNVKVLDSSTVIRNIPSIPVTSTSTLIANNFEEKHILNATEEVLTSIGDESKKNILFDGNIPAVSSVQNFSTGIDIDGKSLIVPDNLALKPKLFHHEAYNYKSEMIPNVHNINNNKSSIVTSIKSLLHSSDVTNRNLSFYDKAILTRVNNSIVSNVLHNGTKDITSSNKDLGEKHIKVGNVTNILKLDKVITKFLTQNYTVLDGNTNSKKFVSSAKTINVNYSDTISSTNNKNDQEITIKIHNTSDDMNQHNIIKTVTNYVNKNDTTKLNNLLAFQHNKSKNMETIYKSKSLENTRIKPELPTFFCRNNTRGRFADESNCRRFYICVGNLIPVMGLCPQNTVFSEFRKQCTYNFSHCIRNNQFKCLKEGRFSDVWHENVYYICMKSVHQKFVSFKFQCQNGYRLDKRNVTCIRALTSVSSVSKSVSSASSISLTDEEGKTEKVVNMNLELNKPLKSDTFKCESEGKFVDPTNSRRYYVCSKTSKSKLRRKRKKCDSDELFDGDKNKCVDKDSHEEK